MMCKAKKESFYNIDTYGLCYKHVTVVIYNRNDSGLYYKTIVSYNLSLG